ncbi:MAG: hypothetical protein R3D00_06600 [Bacteroidia bacterium]
MRFTISYRMRSFFVVNARSPIAICEKYIPEGSPSGVSLEQKLRTEVLVSE